MQAQPFPLLFSPLQIRGAKLKNRIMSTGHDTCLPTDGNVNEALIAYHEARARGGAGLIVVQVAGVHETARYTSHLLMATDDSCIPGYAKLAGTLHRHGCAVFVQLFHPGREIMETADGLLAVAHAPSAMPNERFHVMPRALSAELIEEIIQGYAQAARRIFQAGADGVELVASHGYLPAQFLNPRINRREDAHGENRLLFMQQVLTEIRLATSEDFVIGMRISAGERDDEGLTQAEALQACVDLQPLLDYVNITAGTSASFGAAIHIAAPMAYGHAYLAPDAQPYKQSLTIPVFVTGRINQPQEAEAVLAKGQADICGMTRALICDPEMPAKARVGAADDIRACIACNQACIGHFHRGYPVSCIQHPETGRELRFGAISPAPRRRKVMVAGGGPGGMKAAIEAAKRGHDVTLYEAASQLGGQALLAQLLPRRAEFGGIITNLTRELLRAGVHVVRNSALTPSLVRAQAPDALILATGAKPYRPDFPDDGSVQVLDAWQILRGEAKAGQRVIVADWRGDWIGPGIAELLARQGCSVQLAVNSTHAASALPFYVRDDLVATLHRLRVPIIPYARLYGCADNAVVMQHSASQEPIMFEDTDMLVLCQGHSPVNTLEAALRPLVTTLHLVGDCLAPRTAEEAVYEGLLAGSSI